MANSIENSNSKTSNPVDEVDATTRARCGSLSARGLGDAQIADILLLSYEQVVSVHDTEEFKKKYHEEADRAIQDQIDRDEGWDAVEAESLAILLSGLKFNRDPKFALMAAKMANSAERRARNKIQPKVIGEDLPPGQTNIIVLQINKNYAERDNSQIDITPRPQSIPLKQSDVPAPKLVDQLLAPAKDRIGLINKDRDMTDIKTLFEQSGVVFDEGS